MAVNAILEVYKSRFARRNQRWRWRLVVNNGNKIAESGEGYSDIQEARNMGWSVVNGDYNVRQLDV